MKSWLRFSLPLICFFSVSGCLQPPSLSDDNGPEVAANEVQQSLVDAWGGADPASIRQDEFMYLEQDQKIATLDTKVVYKESTQVLSRQVTPSEIDYTLLIRSQSYENGAFKPVTSVEQNIAVPNISSVETPTQQTGAVGLPLSLESLQKSMSNGAVGLYSGELRQQNFLGVQTLQNMLMACVKDKNWDVTCHNLQITNGVRSVPTGVAGKADCGGFPNCELSYKKISFELVVNLTDEDTGKTHPEKVIYEMTISQDVPYLSRLLEFCYQGMVPTQTQKVLVKMCNRIQNFEPGTPH